MRVFARISILSFVFLSVAADAAETITYTYDARGRLITVGHSGSVNNGVATSYAYDKTDNRTTAATTAGGGMALATPPAEAGSAKAQPATSQGTPK